MTLNVIVQPSYVTAITGTGWQVYKSVKHRSNIKLSKITRFMLFLTSM